MSKIQDALAKAGDRRKKVSPESEAPPEARRDRKAETVGLPLLAPVARNGAQLTRMKRAHELTPTQLVERRIVHPGMGVNEVAKAFKELRTRILQAAGGRNCSVVVSAVRGGDGASFVARNLAATIAFDETKSALLVECNVFGNSQGAWSLDERQPGLTDYLDRDDLALEDVICDVGLPRLRVLPIGTRRGVGKDFFTSAKMARLLDELKTRYHDRFVILDAPPVLESSDAQVLLEASDYAFLVAGWGRVTANAIGEATKAIGPKKLLGIAFDDELRLRDVPLREALAQLGRMLFGRFRSARARRRAASSAE